MKSFLVAGVTAMLFSGAAFAQSEQNAQMACAERAEVVKRLQEKYGETLRDMGLVMRPEGQHYAEIWASDKDKKTFTILLSYPDGSTCLLTAGIGWAHIDHPDPPPIPGQDI